MTHAQGLKAAYERTTYWVDAQPDPIAVRVSARNARLDRFLYSRGATYWAILTAQNPHSEVKPRWYNAVRTLQLTRLMRAHGWGCVRTLAEADRGDWPVEEGVLALGIAHARARRLGRSFHQHAVLVGKRGQRARLLWCSAR